MGGVGRKKVDLFVKKSLLSRTVNKGEKGNLPRISETEGEKKKQRRLGKQESPKEKQPEKKKKGDRTCRD